MTSAPYRTGSLTLGGADKVPRKTFHFDPDLDEAHLVLFEAYMRLAGLCEALIGIVEQEGNDASWAKALLKEADLLVVRAIRYSHTGPSDN